LLKTLRRLYLLLVAVSLLALLAPWANPSWLWPLAILGLAAPYFLGLHVLFLLYWISRRERYAWYGLGVLLMSFTILKGVVGLGSRSVSTTEHLRLVSFNAHMFQAKEAGEGLIDPEVFRKNLKDWNPDILAIQEFVQTPKLRQQFLKVIESAGLTYRNPEQKDGSSILVFSRYPVQQINYRSQNKVSGYLVVDVKTPKGPVRVVNVHLNSNYITGLTQQLADNGDLRERETWSGFRQVLARYRQGAIRRSEQAAQVQELIQKSEIPIILCGDFNDTSKSYTYQVIKGGLQDAFLKAGKGLGATYAGKIPGLRIDYVLCSPSLRVQSCARAPLSFSDHYPLIAELQVP